MVCATKELSGAIVWLLVSALRCRISECQRSVFTGFHRVLRPRLSTTMPRRPSGRRRTFQEPCGEQNDRFPYEFWRETKHETTRTHTHTHTATSSSGLFAAFHRLCGENQRPSEPSSWRPKEHRLASANQLGVSLNRPLQLGRQRRRVSRRRSLRLLGIRFVCLGNFARITTPAVVRPSTCRLQSAIKSYFIKHGSRLRAVSFFFLLPRQIRVAQPNKTTTTATFTTSPHTHTHTHQTPLKKRPNKQQEPVVMPLKISIFPR